MKMFGALPLLARFALRTVGATGGGGGLLRNVWVDQVTGVLSSDSQAWETMLREDGGPPMAQDLTPSWVTGHGLLVVYALSSASENGVYLRPRVQTTTQDLTGRVWGGSPLGGGFFPGFVGGFSWWPSLDAEEAMLLTLQWRLKDANTVTVDPTDPDATPAAGSAGFFALQVGPP